MTNTGSILGGVTNTGSLSSTAYISGGLTNSGTAAIRGNLVGAINNLAGTITFTGGTSDIGLVTQAAGATLDLGANGIAFGALAGDGSVKTNTLVEVGRLNTDTTFAGVISGTGFLIKSGTGTLTLSGANTMTGGAAVSAGTLRIAAGGSMAGGVENLATLVNDGTIGGAVVNYGGGTFTNAGTVAGIVRNDAGAAFTNTGTANAGVDNRGTMSSTGIINTGLVNTGTAQLRGQLNGVIQNNAGSITLTGTLTGVTSLAQVAGASFNMGGFSFAAGELGGGGAIATGGTAATVLTVGAANTGTAFGGVISGAGQLVKTGTGILALSGANTYTGGTTVLNGQLWIGNGGTTGSIVGPVMLNGGGLAVNRSDAVTLSNVISGAGFFAQLGSGTTTLTGLNTYTGGTVIAAGRLRGDVLSLRGNIQIDAGVAEFAQTTAGTYAGRLSGAGAVEKTGAGLLNLTGDNSNFTGVTRLLAGELRVNASLTRSTVTASSGTTLSGAGVLGGLIAQSGSTVAPGNDGIGTLTVAGNVQFLAGSTYAAQIQAASADLLAATGTVQLGGTLAISAVSGPYLFNSAYMVVQGNGGRTGTFGAVTGLGGFGQAFAAQVVYTATGVQIFLAPNRLLAIVGAGQGTANERATLGFIDAAVTAGYNPQPLAALYGLTPTAMLGAADQLSGEVYATSGRVVLDDERLVREAMLGRMREAGDDEGLGMWGQAFGAWGEGDGDGNAAAYDRDLDGFVAGIDVSGKTSVGQLKVGVVGQYGNSEIEVGARTSTTDVERSGVGLFAALESDGFRLSIGGVYSSLKLDTDRSIAFTGFADRLTSHTDGDALQGFGEIAYRFQIDDASAIEPFLQLSTVRIELDALSEGGGPARLQVDAQNIDLFSTTFGLRGETTIALGDDQTLRLRGSLGARHLSGDRSVTALIALDAAPNQALGITSATSDRYAFVGSLDAEYQISESFTLSLGYSGLFSNHNEDHAARLAGSFRF